MFTLKPTSYFLLFLLIFTCSKDETTTINDVQNPEVNSIYFPPINTST
ncbi:hypothetical protein [Lacinutrix sp.]